MGVQYEQRVTWFRTVREILRLEKVYKQENRLKLKNSKTDLLSKKFEMEVHSVEVISEDVKDLFLFNDDSSFHSIV